MIGTARGWVAVGVLLAVLGTGCGGARPSAAGAVSGPGASPAPVVSAGSLPTAGPIPTEGPGGGWRVVYPAHCTARDNSQLPDPACTPGALNPQVTQANIASTICRTGWTATIRPPLSYTSVVKGLAIKAYGSYGGASFGAYELDHLVPLELGGAPWDVRQLWPEHPASPNAKDNVESAARRAVCAGRMPLAAAQQAIAANWIALGHQLGVTGIPAS